MRSDKMKNEKRKTWVCLGSKQSFSHRTLRHFNTQPYTMKLLAWERKLAVRELVFAFISGATLNQCTVFTAFIAVFLLTSSQCTDGKSDYQNIFHYQNFQQI